MCDQTCLASVKFGDLSNCTLVRCRYAPRNITMYVYMYLYTCCAVLFLHEVSHEPVIRGGRDGQQVVPNACTVGCCVIPELPSGEETVARLLKTTASLTCFTTFLFF